MIILLMVFFMFLTLFCPALLTSSSPQEVQNYGLAYNPELEREIVLEFENKFKAKTQKQPILILIGGFQGSGKSSLTACIKKIYDINVISTDSIRQSLFDRGVKISPEFSKYVSNIYNNLVKKCLKINSNILIDANSHSKRITEMEKLLEENNTRYSVVKIFLHASEKTLKDRVRVRKSTRFSCYQGTESDLEGALSSTKIDLKDYDLIVDTDNLSQRNVFELVNDFIFPYFRLQYPAIKNSILHSILISDNAFFSFVNQGINKITQDMIKRAKTDSLLERTWQNQRLEMEHHAITSLDAEVLEPKRRSFVEGIDRSPEHLPFSYNQFKLKSGEPVSASKIEFSTIDPTCPNMIAAQAPMPSTIVRFWSMVFESNSNLIVMLTNLFETDFPRNKVKCTRYWPENIGKTLSLEGYAQVSLISEKLIANYGDEELWHSQLQLIAEEEGETRIVNHYWLKGWKDGKGLNSLEIQDMLLERIHQNLKSYPNNPPIIHCSAGVGRTGTIIGSYLAKHLLVWSPHKSSISKKNLPLEITLFLRYQRSHLIHTFDQYIGFHRFVQFIQPIQHKNDKERNKYFTPMNGLLLGCAITILAIAIFRSKK
jgi:protein tyrosine phosphatase/cytidylate kinase